MSTPGELGTDIDLSRAALDAIRRGEVDAVVVTRGSHTHLYALEPADQSYRQVFEALSVCALVLDERGAIKYANPSFTRMAKTDTSGISGKQFHDYLAPGDRARFDALLPASHTGPQEAHIELHTPSATARVQIGVSALPNEFFPDDPASDAARAPGGFVIVMREAGGGLAAQVEALKDEVQAAEDERARDARDTDVTQRSVLDAQQDVDWIEQQLARGPFDPAVRKRLGSLRDRLRQLALQLRRHLVEGHARLGLAAALGKRARQFQWQFGIHVSTQVELGDLAVDEAQELGIYTLIDEILMNLTRPTQANRATVLLRPQGSGLRIEVQDDGWGVAAFGRSPLGRSAINAIEAHVTQLRGSIEYLNAGGTGAKLVVTVPAKG